jgi:small conductance mechanosensitive channel
VLATTTEPSPAPSSDANEASDLLNEWLADAEGRLIGVLIIVVLVILAWFIGRAIIKAITRGIEHGTPINDRRARKALRKANIKLPEIDDVDARLEAERRRQRARTLRVVLNSGLAVVLIAVLVITVLQAFGIPVGPLLASAGIVGVALGFGAQSLVKDLLAGIFMLIEDQYGVGDIVDLGEATGTVEEVGLRCTRLRSLDGTVWYVPNGEVVRVGNMTRMWSRVMLEVRFAYDTDIEAARQAMIDAVQAAGEADEEIAAAILADPEVPGVESLEFNAVMLRLLCQVNPATQWGVQRSVRREMRRIFDERDIRLAVPGEAMVVDSQQKPGRTRLHDSAHDTADDHPTDDAGRPLPPDGD